MIKQEVEVKHNLNDLLNGVHTHTRPLGWKHEATNVWSKGNEVGCISSGDKANCVQSSDKPLFSLDRIIEENPTLTGPEAQELLKKSIEVENLKYKSELQDKLVELSKLTNLYYKFKEYNTLGIIGKVTKFTIEYNTLYIYMDCITKNSNGNITTSKEPQRYDYNYFCDLESEEVNPELYNNLMNYFVFIENNLK